LRLVNQIWGRNTILSPQYHHQHGNMHEMLISVSISYSPPPYLLINTALLTRVQILNLRRFGTCANIESSPVLEIASMNLLIFIMRS